jgi:formate dehydrogenase subunit beta
VNSATSLAKLTRKDAKTKLAAFLRPCEVRAFLELAKLKQASLDRVLLIGMDCYGRYVNTDYAKHIAPEEGSTKAFLRAAEEAAGVPAPNGADIASACKSCVTPVADNVDLRLVVIGLDAAKELGLEALSVEGEAALEALELVGRDAPTERGAAVEELVAKRTEWRNAVRAEYREKVSSIDGLLELISPCVNCYNCRAVCPVCYCRECVFTSDTFSHDSRQYFDWAKKRGRLRMPADTLFYHLTRMAHMSTLCVGCGQCSSACPNDIPLAELFGMVGDEAQAVFGYLPGRDPEEAQPLASFIEEELHEVTGQVK